MLRRHRVTLLGMGVPTGYLGAAPSIVWASGCRVCRSVCGSLAVGHLDLHAGFAFSSLWFAHFCLQALAQLRAANSARGRSKRCCCTGRARQVQPPPSPINSIEIYGSLFGLIIVGDEILSGKRADKHLPKVIELLGARGLALSYADYVGDNPERLTATLQGHLHRQTLFFLWRHRGNAR